MLRGEPSLDFTAPCHNHGLRIFVERYILNISVRAERERTGGGMSLGKPCPEPRFAEQPQS